jgi:hypothetical protein
MLVLGVSARYSRGDTADSISCWLWADIRESGDVDADIGARIQRDYNF